MNDPVFIDTWGWLAYGHRRDAHHLRVQAIMHELRQQRTRLHTSDYVLDELISLLFRREPFAEAQELVQGILDAISQKSLRLERITPKRFATAWALRQQYDDKPWFSFTDLTSMAVMQELRIRRILTEDEHFLQAGMGFLQVL